MYFVRGVFLAAVTASIFAQAATAIENPAFVVVDEYASSLASNTPSDITGPSEIDFVTEKSGVQSTPEKKPISQLRVMLSSCVPGARAYSYGKPGYPGWVMGFYYWGCGATHEEGVKATVTTSLDGKSIESVQVVSGGRFIPMPPPPPGWKKQRG